MLIERGRSGQTPSRVCRRAELGIPRAGNKAGGLRSHKRNNDPALGLLALACATTAPYPANRSTSMTK